MSVLRALLYPRHSRFRYHFSRDADKIGDMSLYLPHNPYIALNDTHEAYARLSERARNIRLQIAQLGQDLLDILTQQNALAPINRFPDELLVATLRHLVMRPGPGTNKALFRATHICRRWRDLVVHTPSLWTQICVDKETVTETLLARSRRMPISVYVPYGSKPGTLTPHFHRLRCLHIDERVPPNVSSASSSSESSSESSDSESSGSSSFSSDDSDEDAMEQMPSGPSLAHNLPILEALHLYGGTSGRLGRHSLFSRSMPSLHKLHIEDVWLYSPITFTHASLTCTLRELSLHRVNWRSFGLYFVLQTLAEFPQLEHLRIAECTAERFFAQSSSPALLPRLVSMRVVDVNSTFYTTLLRRLVLPASVILSYELSNSTMHLKGSLIASLNDFCPPISGLRNLSCTAKCNPEDSSKTDLSFSAFDTSNAPPNHSLTLQLKRCAAPVIADIYPVHELEELYICDWTRRSALATGWPAACERMAALKLLRLDRPQHGGAFLQLLGMLAVGLDERLPCMALRCLVLGSALGDPDFWDTLECVTSTRLAHGSPLPNVQLSGFIGEMDEGRIKVIRMQVGQLVLER